MKRALSLSAEEGQESAGMCVRRAEDIVSFSFEQFVSQYNTTYCIFLLLYSDKHPVSYTVGDC